MDLFDLKSTKEVTTMEIRLLTTEDAEIYLKVCMEGLTKNPEAFSSSYEDVLKHEDPVAAMAKRLSNPDKYTLGVFKDNDLIGIATLETKPFIKQEHKAKIGSVLFPLKHVALEQDGLSLKQLLRMPINYM